MNTEPANASFAAHGTMDAGFEETVQKVKQEWGNFWTYMTIFGSLVILVVLFSR